MTEFLVVTENVLQDTQIMTLIEFQLFGEVSGDADELRKTGR